MLTTAQHTKFTNKLSAAKKTQIITALCEGVLGRVHFKNDGRGEGYDLAAAGASRHGLRGVPPTATVRNVKAKPVQVDELWSFCYCKQKR